MGPSPAQGPVCVLMVLLVALSAFVVLFVTLEHLVHSSQGKPLETDPHNLNQANFHARVDRRYAPSRSEGGSPSLAPWELWHRNMPACSSSANLSGGEVYVTKHGDIVYEPAHCYLRRLAADEARRCLTGRHVAFIGDCDCSSCYACGDSVTRYQYLSLAYFLCKKYFPERHGNVDGSPSLTWEKEWPSWKDFLARGSAILSGAVEGCAKEECDCHRDEKQSHGRALQDSVREYRKFSLHYPHSCYMRHPAKQHELTLSFYVTFGQLDKHDSQVGGEALQHHANHILQVPPTDIIYNEGLWMIGQGWPEDRMDRFLFNMTSKLGAFQQVHDGTSVVYKTTTPFQNKDTAELYHAMELSHAKKANVSVMDVFAAVKAFVDAGLAEIAYVDENHFRPFVYEQLNDVLLNHLCN